MDVNYIVLAIPVFFLLIGVELVVSWLKKTPYYRFNDAITNLSCGIGQQVTGVFMKTAVFLAYAFAYEHWRIFDISNAWWVWIALFIGVDFFYYWFHRLAHEISVLWGSHIVHHQSEEYNLTVALRQAWLQGAFSWVFYMPLAYIGFDPIMFVAVNSFQTLYQFWIHTKTINKLPAWFEYIFNTPSHHRVHHGVNPKYIDKNHAGTLIIWDRMFGTFQPEEEEVVYGITTQAKSWNPLWLNFQYWIDLFRAVARARSWGDRWRILVREPGWMPEELGGPLKPKEVTSDTFNKYDTVIPKGLNYYILFQYFVVLGGATGYLFMVDGMDWVLKIGLAAMIIVSIVNLGAIFEMKRWVYYLEYLRILVLPLVTVTLFYNHELLVPVIAVSALYLVTSMYWFARHRQVFSMGPSVEAESQPQEQAAPTTTTTT